MRKKIVTLLADEFYFQNVEARESFRLAKLCADKIMNWVLRALPEEKILHEYMQQSFNGPDGKAHPSEYWEGWNEYRKQAMLNLADKKYGKKK